MVNAKSAVAPEQLLELGLRAASTRQAVIANNIANLGTPGFRRSEVRFEEHLARALAGGQELSATAAEVYQPGGPMSEDGSNNVNLDVEVGEMVKNVATYKTYLRMMAKRYQQMDLAMRTE